MSLFILDEVLNNTTNIMMNYPTFGYVGGYFAIYFSLLLAFIISCMLIICCIISLCSCFYTNNSDDEPYEKQRFLVINYKNLYNNDEVNLASLYAKISKRKHKCCISCYGSEQNIDQESENDEDVDDSDINTKNKQNTIDSLTLIKTITTKNIDKKDAIDLTFNKSNLTNVLDSSDNNKSNESDSLIASENDNEVGIAKRINPIINPTIIKNQVDISKEKPKTYLYYLFDNMNSTNSITDISPIKSKNDQFVDLDIFVKTVLNTASSKNTIILLGISSPGGYAYKFELAYTRLMRLRAAGFKLIALIDDICASGGYMLAAACNQIICAEYASIGSIGVVTSIYNYHELIKKIGVVEKTITSGPYKRPYPTGEPIEQNHIDMVKEGVQDTLEIFSNIVKTSRKFSDNEMKDILSAKVWYGRKALEMKLVDKIATSGEYIDSILKQNSENKIYVITRKSENEKSFIKTIVDSTIKYMTISAGISLNKIISENIGSFKEFIIRYMADTSINHHITKYDIDKIV